MGFVYVFTGAEKHKGLSTTVTYLFTVSYCCYKRFIFNIQHYHKLYFTCNLNYN